MSFSEPIAEENTVIYFHPRDARLKGATPPGYELCHANHRDPDDPDDPELLSIRYQKILFAHLLNFNTIGRPHRRS